MDIDEAVRILVGEQYLATLRGETKKAEAIKVVLDRRLMTPPGPTEAEPGAEINQKKSTSFDT